jgi:hypothetical protein
MKVRDEVKAIKQLKPSFHPSALRPHPCFGAGASTASIVVLEPARPHLSIRGLGGVRS